MKKLFLLLAMLAVLYSGVAGDISPLEGVPVLGMPKAEAFETKPVNFVVIDRTRSVGKADMRGWIQMVKMDYHVPYYRLGALVVMVVHRMDSYMVTSHSPFDHDMETYVRTFAYADMYAYNSDGNKFIRRFLRETDLKPLGLAEEPSDTIKWTLGNLLNKMEGKPQI